MRVLPAVVVMIVFAAAGPLWAQQAETQPAGDSCVECHALLDGELAHPAEVFEQDVHRRTGISCAGCHGGDPTSDDMEISMSPAKGFKGKIDRLGTPSMCAGCHSDAVYMRRFRPQQRVDQLTLYSTSVHGQRLADGDLNVANCVDCHSVHDIREVRHALSPVHPRNLPRTCAQCHADSAHMSDYGISTAQFEDYTQSVHWEALAERGDLSAPTCATCHGNHGAAPPGVDSVAQVCGSCHIVFKDLFESSPHREAFEAMGLSACVTCHSNHDVPRAEPTMLGVDEGAVCADCHVEGETAFDVARTMRERMDELRAALSGAEEILDRAEASGMEVSDGRMQWTSAQEQWIMARVQVHSLSSEAVEEAAAEGLEITAAAYQAGTEALEERDYRRMGLGIALLTIAITIAGLWLAVKAIEEKDNQATGG